MQYSEMVEELAGIPGVTLGTGRRGFGAAALRVDGHIFAMARRGGLVLKLPAARVGELLASGAGTPFDAGRTRRMREWVIVGRDAERDWLRLAGEALDFVRKEAR